MVGQIELLKTLNSYTLDTLPKTILLIGEQGCGKKTVTKELAKRFEVNIIDFSKPTEDTISDAEELRKARKRWNDTIADRIIDAQTRPVDTIYLIDLDSLSGLDIDKEQATFLKFIEEPSKFVHIILTTTSEICVLPTILNRCTKYKFAPYTLDELKQINWFSSTFDDVVLKICKTPGKIKNADSNMIHAMYDTCTRLVSKLNNLQFADVLTLTNRINYKEEYNKYDFTLFLNALELAAFTEYLNNNTEAGFKVYSTVNTLRQKLVGKQLVKETFITNLLLQLCKN